jgi:hypothetical protein
MGVYNPKAPQILGQEWVPIRSSDVVFSPSVNTVELGHTFSLTASRTIQDARFYIKEQPPGETLNQVYFINIYPKGAEALSGPVQSVLIPCNSGATSGSGISISPAADIPTALLNPGDGLGISVIPNTNTSAKSLNLFFGVNGYAQLLMGKRILAVNLVHQLSWDPIESGVPGSVASRQLVYTAGQGLTWETGTGSTASYAYAPIVGTYGTDLLGLNPPIGALGSVQQLQRVQLGEIDRFWSSPSAQFFGEQLPWRFQGLQRFEASAGTNRYRIHYDFGGITEWAGTYYLGYAALEVLYCEETRVAYGGRNFFGGSPSLYQQGVNIITIRDLNQAATPSLAAGEYTVTVSSPDVGDVTGPFTADITRKAEANPYPTLNGAQQLYPIDSHTGVQLNITQTEDETFTAEETDVLAQISLHLSTGPVNEVHVYGDQVQAQVYGTITATQEILDSAAGGAQSFPWVRFYARRFGETTAPLKLDSPTITGSSVSITPAEFDVLDEIVDGWKEVTLRFDNAPTMGSGTNPQWRWSATGETAGNRWEVLGAIAPAISGLASNLLNTVPSPQQLSLATYGSPVSGANINLGWIPGYSPLVSATTDDPSSDAALMFARDLPTITGFSSSIQDQEVVGIGLDCGLDPCCIPTEIQYVQLTWTPQQGLAIFDGYNRTVVNGWGTADSGQTWNASGTTPFQVQNGKGLHLFDSVTTRHSTVNMNWVNTDVQVDFFINLAPTGGTTTAGVFLRWNDTSNYYAVHLTSTSTYFNLDIRRVVGGSAVILSTITTPFLVEPNQIYHVRGRAFGSQLMGRAWLDGETEPDTWDVYATDTNFASGLAVGVRSSSNVAEAAMIGYFDNFYAIPTEFIGSKIEIQRMDTVETDWKTIMLSSNLALTGFKDYEARVGIQSSYRIRLVDPYDFPGPWSSTITATIPAPGVTIGCDDGHLLIFTSNEQQDGSVNLAYSSVWEQGRTVEEAFAFPEAGFVQLQAMYNRDFFTAFRPTERGGEQFQRTVLVQAAAISPETLADFTSLRDMAWADTSYICVRDEDGNRWLATVLVPSGRVLRDRRMYLAPVDIIEVTDTPSQVDP